MIHYAVITSPIGALTVAVSADRVCALFFGDCRPAVQTFVRRWYGDVVMQPADDPAGAVTALREYFEGDLSALDRLDVELNGTDFQQRVWAALRRVGAGRTASYRDIARLIAAPHAVRAVGAANGANPVALIVPCHRIIGAHGTLTGYGGGLETKRWLLRHEGILLV